MSGAPGLPLRAAFQAVADNRAATVTPTSPHVFSIRPASAPSYARSALLVVGRNRLDAGLFERCALHNLDRFLEDNWSVILIDLHTAVGRENGVPAPGTIVADALAAAERLCYVVMLTHSRYAINLSESGNDLISARPIKGAAAYPSVPISQLRLSESAKEHGWIDMFGCLCRPDAAWPRELATALNWPVRTVYPGYSIYFPGETAEPRSAIPFTRRFLRDGYATRGWAVWLPGAARPLRVSEPGKTVRRYGNRLALLEYLLTRVISRGLEPVRDIRKRRKYALQARG